MAKRTAAAVLLTVLAGAGCVTKGEGEKIWADIRALQAQNNEILRTLNEQKARLVALNQQADQKITSLKRLIEQVEKIVRRGNVDFFQQLQQIQQEISRTSGRVEQAERNVDVLRRDLDAFREETSRKLAKMIAQPPKVEDTLPADPEMAYQAAARELAAGQYDKAVTLFLEIMKRFPRHPRLEDIQFGLADAYYGKRDWRHAVAEYGRFYQDFGSSDRAPEALFKVAKCYEELGDLKTAILSLKVITKKFKRSSFARDARKLIKQLQKRI